MKKLLVSVIFFVCLLAYAQDAQELISKSHDKIQKGDYDGAIADARKAIEIDPKLAVSYNNLGLAYFFKGNFKEAIEQYDKAVTLGLADNPTWMIVYFNRANARRLLGEYDKSIEDCNKVLELRKWAEDLSDEDKEIYFIRGWNYLAKNDYKKAEADFNKAIEINKHYVQAHNYLGIVYLEQNDFKKAIEVFSKAIAETPKGQFYPDAYSCRGQAYLASNDLTRAIVDFTEILEKDPQSPVGLELRADTYFLKGSFDRAVRDYNGAIKSGGATPARCLKLYNSAMNLSNPQPELDKFNSYAGQLKETDWLIAAVRFYQGKATEEEALKAAESPDVIARNENLCRANYYISAFYLGKKDTAKAKEYFQKAISFDKKFLIEHIFANWEIQGIK